MLALYHVEHNHDQSDALRFVFGLDAFNDTIPQNTNMDEILIILIYKNKRKKINKTARSMFYKRFLKSSCNKKKSLELFRKTIAWERDVKSEIQILFLLKCITMCEKLDFSLSSIHLIESSGSHSYDLPRNVACDRDFQSVFKLRATESSITCINAVHMVYEIVLNNIKFGIYGRQFITNCQIAKKQNIIKPS